METGHEFFMHGMQDMLDAENKLVEALGKQAKESSRPDLQKAFESHQKQTQNQVERLKQAFESIGESPEKTECAGIKGLIEEHDNFKEEEPSADLMDIFNVEAGAKVERYEITSYEGLVKLARMMGHKKAERLLSQNLKEEEATLRKLEKFSDKLKPENMGMDENDEKESASSGRRRRTSGRRAA